MTEERLLESRVDIQTAKSNNRKTGVFGDVQSGQLGTNSN